MCSGKWSQSFEAQPWNAQSPKVSLYIIIIADAQSHPINGKHTD